jgi:hypothetical protein
MSVSAHAAQREAKARTHACVSPPMRAAAAAAAVAACMAVTASTACAYPKLAAAEPALAALRSQRQSTRNA